MKNLEEKKYDIVYVLKEDVAPDELRFSLRSVCENFDYRHIWFYGGCPPEIKPDYHVKLRQTGNDKWSRTRSMYETILGEDRLSDHIWLFNDDFFVWSKPDLEPRIIGTLEDRIKRIETKYGRVTGYTKRLRYTASALRHYGTLDYESHSPFLVDRQKGLEILRLFPRAAFRSSYGNYYHIGGELTTDGKITDMTTHPFSDFVSTSDRSFRQGIVGTDIRSRFIHPCKYETLEPLPEYYWDE